MKIERTTIWRIIFGILGLAFLRARDTCPKCYARQRATTHHRGVWHEPVTVKTCTNPECNFSQVMR